MQVVGTFNIFNSTTAPTHSLFSLDLKATKIIPRPQKDHAKRCSIFLRMLFSMKQFKCLKKRFLENEKNKTKDADVLIAQHFDTVFVVGEDVDFLVLLHQSTQFLAGTY